MALLDIVKDAAALLGLSPPSAVASAPDLTTQQLFAQATQAGKEVAAFHDWSGLSTGAVFTGDGVTTAFNLPNDFSRFAQGQLLLLDGGWTRLSGPLDPMTLTFLRSQSVSTIANQFYRRGNVITITPALANGRNAYFEYVSNAWCVPASGSNKTRFTLDNDTTIFDEDLVMLGLVWKWRSFKGFDYAQDYETWRQRCELAAARDGPLTPATTTPGMTQLPDPIIPDTIVVP